MQVNKISMQVNLFISYSRDDGADFALHLRKHLQEKQYDVFLDTKSLSVGANWRARIESAIDTCDVFLFIITTDSLVSNEVKEEFDLAISKRKLLMLFKHRSVQIDDLKWGLKDRNIHEFFTQEELIRIFDDRFLETDKLLTRDLNDPLVVQNKLLELKREFDVVP